VSKEFRSRDYPDAPVATEDEEALLLHGCDARAYGTVRKGSCGLFHRQFMSAVGLRE
jgi:hypothetical protein